MTERRGLSILVAVLGLAALAFALLPFAVRASGWLGYTPLTPPAQVSVLPRATCPAPIVSAWHAATERVTIPVGIQLVAALKACRVRARHRLETSTVLVVAGVLAWVFLVRTLRRAAPPRSIAT